MLYPSAQGRPREPGKMTVWKPGIKGATVATLAWIPRERGIVLCIDQVLAGTVQLKLYSRVA